MKSLPSFFKLFHQTKAESWPLINLNAHVEAEAAKNRGNELLSSGDYLSATRCYQEALNLQPTYAEAHVNLGATFRQLGRFQEAKEHLQRAVNLKPSLWQAHFQIGLLHNELGQFQSAVDSYNKSLELNAENPECLTQLGLSLVKLDKWTEAIKAFDSTNIPGQISQEVHVNWGFALMKRDQPEAALHHFQIALNLGETSDLHLLMGKIYERLFMKPEAELSYRNAVELNPDNSEAHFQLSFLLLLKGNYLNGFKHYERRLKLNLKLGWLDPLKDTLTCLGDDQYWKGEEIRGTRILIIPEQGLGDALMMLRYVPLLKTLKFATELSVICDESLERIFQSIPEVDEVRVIPTVITKSDCDWYCTAMSLPHVFGTELNSIPSSPNLAIPEQLRIKWRERVRGLDGYKVGIVWSGNKFLETDTIRSITLDKLDALFSIPGVIWVSLQKGGASQQLKDGKWPIYDWMNESQDLMDTAALIDCLDLVITVDTSIVHLAGVIGRPTWLLNRYDTDWRWLREGDDTPWYPSVRIFRQTTRNDWDGVIEKVVDDLRLQLQS